MTPESLAVVSVDEFWGIAQQMERAELVAGVVVEVTPATARHGAIAIRLGRLLDEHVSARRLGVVVAETGFILSRDPATVRAPDVAVIRGASFDTFPTRGFVPRAPDLAVEILSPDDRPGEVAAMIADYLRAGTQAVWVVDPEARTVTVHTGTGAVRYVEEETLDGTPTLPAFRQPVRALLGEAP